MYVFAMCYKQQFSNWFPGMLRLSASLCSKCTVYPENVGHLQVLTMHKKYLS